MFTIWTFLVALHEIPDPEGILFVFDREYLPCDMARAIQDFVNTGNKHLDW